MYICQNLRGLVPKLCDKYSVSRTFIYDLRQKYIDFVNEEGVALHQGVDLGDLDSLWLMLSLRMEGKCSIEGIHSVMRRLGYSRNSVGNISAKLHEVGSKLGGDLGVGNVSVQKYVFCCDEIFAKSQPILMSVEPVSLQILGIELV